MKIIDISIDEELSFPYDISLCLGYFDGVHLGHQNIIKAAKKYDYPIGILSFDNSPSFLSGTKGRDELTSVADKADIFSSLGVKYLFIMHFDESSLLITKDEFIERILNKIHPKVICCGEDYSFGTRKEGNPEYLKRFFDVELVDILKIDDKKVSTSYIKDLIKMGDVKTASRLLNRPYRLTGLVVEGNHNGTKIDFPTANLDLDHYYTFPKEGVYIGYCYFLNRKRKAIVSISTHPTINQLLDPIIEIHIIDFNENIYGKTLSIDLIDYIRDIITFPNLIELKNQLIIDRDYAKKVL